MSKALVRLRDAEIAELKEELRLVLEVTAKRVDKLERQIEQLSKNL